jgi:putative serine protease PepD
LSRAALRILHNLGPALTAAAAAIAVIVLVDSTVARPLFASSAAGSQATSQTILSVEQVAAKVLPSVVTLQVVNDEQAMVGSGIILTQDGLIMTNYHVVAGANPSQHTRARTTVVLDDGRTSEFDVVATDFRSDIAVVRALRLSGLTPISIGSSANLRIGQQVVAVGSPLGLEGTVTNGIISALHRTVHTRVDAADGLVAYEAIQTDAAVNPGNSGGALVDAHGRLIGVNSAEAVVGGTESAGTAPHGSIGLGFAIPVDQAMRVAAELIATGRAAHGWLGAQVNNDMTVRGAEIVDVTPGSPAAAAGLTPGAVVTNVDGYVVATGSALLASIQSRAPGAGVTLVFIDTSGNSRTVAVNLGTDLGTDHGRQ